MTPTRPKTSRAKTLRWAIAALLVAAVTVGFATQAAAVSVSISGPVPGSPIRQGFVGATLEYYAVPQYTGTDPGAVNPLLVELLRQLAPGQTPVLRIGGKSTDATWWPVAGVTRPAGVNYDITPTWLQTTSALLQALHAQLIAGLNLAVGRPDLAAAEARALLAAVGSQSIGAFEIGNEPDLFAPQAWYRTSRGPVYARPRAYSLSEFASEFAQVRSALPAAPVAGPGFSGSSWMAHLGRFLATEPHLSLVTFHRYALNACNVPRRSPSYPTIAALLADSASHGLASGVAPYAALAHARGLPFRVDEINSVTCGGVPGVSDTFASALWALDTLFELARAGVDGVNIQTSPGGSYQIFTFQQLHGGWQAVVRPEYYGLLMFAEATPRGSRLLSLSGTTSSVVKSWATLAPNGVTRVVLINKDTAHAHTARVRPTGAVQTAVLERLLAPSVRATSGVTLAGQSFGVTTSSGALTGTRRTTVVTSAGGVYSVRLPAASAAMLTLHPVRG